MFFSMNSIISSVCSCFIAPIKGALRLVVATNVGHVWNIGSECNKFGIRELDSSVLGNI